MLKHRAAVSESGTDESSTGASGAGQYAGAVFSAVTAPFGSTVFFAFRVFSLVLIMPGELQARHGRSPTADLVLTTHTPPRRCGACHRHNQPRAPPRPPPSPTPPPPSPDARRPTPDAPAPLTPSHQAVFVDDFVKGLFAVIAIMTDFMASVPKIVLVALLGGAASAVCSMCAYCCWCHKPPEDIEDSDDEGEGGARGPGTFKTELPKQEQPHSEENNHIGAHHVFQELVRRRRTRSRSSSGERGRQHGPYTPHDGRRPQQGVVNTQFPEVELYVCSASLETDSGAPSAVEKAVAPES